MNSPSGEQGPKMKNQFDPSESPLAMQAAASNSA